MYTYMYMHMYVYVYVYVYMCMCMCICICVCICICICIWICICGLPGVQAPLLSHTCTFQWSLMYGLEEWLGMSKPKQIEKT